MANENFDNYTEVDVPADYLTKTSTRVTATSMIRNTSVYVYKDFGADHFDDFTHDFDMRYTDVNPKDSNPATDGACFFAHGVSNALGDYIEAGGTNESIISVFFYFMYSTNKVRIYVQEQRNDSGTADYWEGATKDTTYYIRMVKSSTSLVVGIYSTSDLRDAGDGTDGDVDNLSITISDDTYQYCYAGQSVTSAWNGNAWISAYVENLNLNEAVAGKASSSIIPLLGVLDII